MAVSSKRMNAIREQLEPGKAYAIDEALELLRSASKVKFKESVDVAIRLGVDPRKSDQNVRGSTVLPNEQARPCVWPCSPRVKTQTKPVLQVLMWSGWTTFMTRSRAVT